MERDRDRAADASSTGRPFPPTLGRPPPPLPPTAHPPPPLPHKPPQAPSQPHFASSHQSLPPSRPPQPPLPSSHPSQPPLPPSRPPQPPLPPSLSPQPPLPPSHPPQPPLPPSQPPHLPSAPLPHDTHQHTTDISIPAVTTDTERSGGGGWVSGKVEVEAGEGGETEEGIKKGLSVGSGAFKMKSFSMAGGKSKPQGASVKGEGVGGGGGGGGMLGKRSAGGGLGGISMKLKSQAEPAAKKSKVLERPPANPKSTSALVAKAFGSDSEEEEEMPAEAKLRMRNIGKNTPTSAGPNSFHKSSKGFSDPRGSWRNEDI